MLAVTHKARAPGMIAGLPCRYRLLLSAAVVSCCCQLLLSAAVVGCCCQLLLLRLLLSAAVVGCCCQLLLSAASGRVAACLLNDAAGSMRSCCWSLMSPFCGWTCRSWPCACMHMGWVLGHRRTARMQCFAPGAHKQPVLHACTCLHVAQQVAHRASCSFMLSACQA